MNYKLDLSQIREKNIYPLGEDFCGTSSDGTEISFTNYYMQKNGRPFFGVSGELHFSRMTDDRWEDELIKMKMAGINTVSTYVFWNHHEEEEGCFCFEGRRNLRKFVLLCQKHDLYVILRVGPFNHGEARNGGMPDWMYGKPFEVRSMNDGFMWYTRRLYTQIGKQVDGLFFKDGGPIIGVQLDNEYMHSAAPWEMTTGISNEWLPSGTDGDDYLLALKQMAKECGLLPVFYTCTGWGGAATPESVMPLWGGYAFRPWLFYSYVGEHPATEEYVYQDYHNNEFACTDDFKPVYKPETKPYACCEMGGGMMCCYYYRFQLPYKSIDAMSNIKMASGCNFLGYYMFHGGSNPVGKGGTFLNESQVTKISYDYQAALGEFGQVRESYRRLKTLHYFVNTFGESFCSLQTVIPEGAEKIEPKDDMTLRYAVRTDGKRGFVFINNYQDHFELPERKGETVTLCTNQETLTFHIDIAGDENAILPFHFDMGGIDLVQASAQVITKTAVDGMDTYVFLIPAGMQGEFVFEDAVTINGCATNRYQCSEKLETALFTVEKENRKCNVLVLSREMANNMYMLRDGSLVFTDAAILEDKDGLRLESGKAENRIYTYPKDRFVNVDAMQRVMEEEKEPLGTYLLCTKEYKAEVFIQQVGPARYTLTLPTNVLDGVKDVLLQIDYKGDIGNAFINGRLINDNFSNDAVWEIGLKEFAEELKENPITLYIVPLKEGVNVKVESTMAARSEEITTCIAKLNSVKLQPVYDIQICN